MRGFRKLTKNDAIENISDKKESDRNMKKYQIMAKRTSKSVSCFLYILVQIHSVNFNSLNIGKKKKEAKADADRNTSLTVTSPISYSKSITVD